MTVELGMDIKHNAVACEQLKFKLHLEEFLGDFGKLRQREDWVFGGDTNRRFTALDVATIAIPHFATCYETVIS
jgi:hypothetical protein